MPLRHLVAYIHTLCYRINPNLNNATPSFYEVQKAMVTRFPDFLGDTWWENCDVSNHGKQSSVIFDSWNNVIWNFCCPQLDKYTGGHFDLEKPGWPGSCLCLFSPLLNIRVCPKLCESVAIFSHSCSNFLFWLLLPKYDFPVPVSVQCACVRNSHYLERIAKKYVTKALFENICSVWSKIDCRSMFLFCL